jgi:hypothetical protein
MPGPEGQDAHRRELAIRLMEDLATAYLNEDLMNLEESIRRCLLATDLPAHRERQAELRRLRDEVRVLARHLRLAPPADEERVRPVGSLAGTGGRTTILASPPTARTDGE